MGESVSCAQNACCCLVRGLRGVAVVACCCLVRGLRGVAVVAAVVHDGMVTTVLGLARSRGAGVVERLLNQVHGTCRGLTRF